MKELNFEPGTSAVRSWTDSYLLGRLLQAAINRPIEEFVGSVFFWPLKMDSTVPNVDPRAVVPKLATGDVRVTTPGSTGSAFQHAPDDLSTIGGQDLLTTVEEGLAKWEAALDGQAATGQRPRVAWDEDWLGSNSFSIAGVAGGHRFRTVRYVAERFNVIASCNDAGAHAEVLTQRMKRIYLGGYPVHGDTAGDAYQCREPVELDPAVTTTWKPTSS